MTKQEFMLKILHTPCEKCPIKEFCSLLPNLSCTTIAKKYYETHKDENGGVYIGTSRLA